MVNRGSYWRKWNFHVHTKGTNKNDCFKSKTMDDFFYTFFKKAYEHQISAIGITDYFSIEHYLEAVHYQKSIYYKQDIIDGRENIFTLDEYDFISKIFLFPNIELRIVPTTDKGKKINIHCLFNPDFVNRLDHDFFQKVCNQENHAMTKEGISHYGKTLIPDSGDSQEQYITGIKNYVISLEKLNSIISGNKELKENTLLVVSNKSQDGVSGIQHYHPDEKVDGIKKSIYRASDLIFSASEQDVNYFLGKKSKNTDKYNEEVYQKEVAEVIKHKGSLKPCVVGCDAHSEESLFCKKEGNPAFTWIKADLSFEGLKQICLEPEQRVKIQHNKPDFKEERFIIDKVQFTSPNHIFSTSPIYLNPNLNVIIGGKSSGKSILLYAIAKTLLENSKDKILEKQDETLLYNLNEIDEGFDFEVTSTGNFSQKLSSRKNINNNSIIPEIKYIPQNYLVKLAEPTANKMGAPLNKIVRNLIIEDHDAKLEYDNFIQNVTQNDGIRNAKIDLYFKTSQEIEKLANELKAKASKEILDGNIATNQKKIDELNKETGLTAEQVEEYKDLQKKLEDIKNKKTQITQAFGEVKTFNAELIGSILELKQKKEHLIKNIPFLEIKEYYNSVYSALDSFEESFMQLHDSFKIENTDDGSKIIHPSCQFYNLIVQTKDEEQTLEKKIEPYLKNEKIKPLIKQLEESIKNDKKVLESINVINLRVKNLQGQLKDTKEAIFNIYSSSYHEYINVINKLKERTNTLEQDGLSIVGKAKFNFSKFRKKLLDCSDGRSASYRNYTILQDNKKIDGVSYDIILEEIKKLFTDILDNKYVLIPKTSPIEAIRIIFDDYFFDYWEITYKNDKLGEMSTGKASFVILMLIIGLSRSKSPILLDQPEDNLDNRSITTDLVSYLRKKKLERQIIIVTHNANIVVNADAENIIVANQKGQNNESSSSPFKFDYINGALENSFDKNIKETNILKSMGIRQHVADIVEGGKEAFKMRERKYRFS